MPRLESATLACCRWQKLCSTRSTSRAHRYSEAVPSEAAPSGGAGGESAPEALATSCWTAAVSWPCGWPELQPQSSSKDSASRSEHATAKQASCTAAHLRRVRLQPQVHASFGLQPRVAASGAASGACCCSLECVGMQPAAHGVAASDARVAASGACGCGTPLRLSACPDVGDELEAEHEGRAHLKCASPPRLVKLPPGC